jgi:hypothetical protein
MTAPLTPAALTDVEMAALWRVFYAMTMRFGGPRPTPAQWREIDAAYRHQSDRRTYVSLQGRGYIEWAHGSHRLAASGLDALGIRL